MRRSVRHQTTNKLKAGTSSSAQPSCPSSPSSEERWVYFPISRLLQVGEHPGHSVAAGGTQSSSRQLMCCPQRLNPPWAKAFAMARTYIQHGSMHGDVRRAKQPQARAGWWKPAVRAPSLPFPSFPFPATSPCPPYTDAPTAEPWTTRPSQLSPSSFLLGVEVQGLKGKLGGQGREPRPALRPADCFSSEERTGACSCV